MAKITFTGVLPMPRVPVSPLPLALYVLYRD